LRASGTRWSARGFRSTRVARASDVRHWAGRR
jgi:hypothetical protein